MSDWDIPPGPDDGENDHNIVTKTYFVMGCPACIEDVEAHMGDVIHHCTILQPSFAA